MGEETPEAPHSGTEREGLKITDFQRLVYIELYACSASRQRESESGREPRTVPRTSTDITTTKRIRKKNTELDSVVPFVFLLPSIIAVQW